MVATELVKRYKRIHLPFRLTVLIIGVIGLGVSLAFLLASPTQKLATSVLTTLLFLLVIWLHP